MTDNADRKDLYSRITDRIIDELGKGERPWLKPWKGGHGDSRITAPLRHTGTPYRGMNVLLLWWEAVDKGFVSSIWMTYKQAEALGAQVRKGERGSLVVYADNYTKTERNDKGEEVERSIGFMKGYTVFNTDQIDGLPAHYYTKPEPKGEPVRLIDAAEAFFTATGARVQHGGDSAFYAPSRDCIQMPPAEAFTDIEAYTATKAHEFVHWTGHAARCARKFGTSFGDSAYAREELVAELGAAFLCAALGVTPEPREDHAAYLGHWLGILKEDKRAIFSAAAHAQRACDYLHGLQVQQAKAA